jgi:hypothetical protein
LIVELPASVKGCFSLNISTLTGINVMEKKYEMSSPREILENDLKGCMPEFISSQCNQMKKHIQKKLLFNKRQSYRQGNALYITYLIPFGFVKN